MNYGVTGEGKTFEYQMVIHSPDREKTRGLSEALNALTTVTAFRISPNRRLGRRAYSSYASALPASAVLDQLAVSAAAKTAP